MLHPSYTDLMKVVNSEVEPGEAPVVNSRYSIVMATAKRARQIIAGDEPLVTAKVDNLNLAMLRDELRDLCIYLQKLFGRNSMKESIAYLERLQKLF